MRHSGADIAAPLRDLLGGALPDYPRPMAGAREQSLDPRTAVAEALNAGALAISALRNATGTLACGTSVRPAAKRSGQP